MPTVRAGLIAGVMLALSPTVAIAGTAGPEDCAVLAAAIKPEQALKILQPGDYGANCQWAALGTHVYVPKGHPTGRYVRFTVPNFTPDRRRAVLDYIEWDYDPGYIPSGLTATCNLEKAGSDWKIVGCKELVTN